MARLVMKFGGTSVADIEHIRNVARHVKREVDAGHEVAVVTSAMAGATNRLVEWCRDRIAHYKCPRRVVFVEALPRHDNGKLYKHQLREQLRQTSFRPTP